jgi:transcriptional regulator with XRE-family HTH domain
MATRVLSQAARELYLAAYPVGPTEGSVALAAWMTSTSTHAREVAAQLGCTALSVRSWASGRRVPTIELARRIEALTGVPIAAWVTLRPPAIEAAATTGGKR